jgi:phage shock protein E
MCFRPIIISNRVDMPVDSSWICSMKKPFVNLFACLLCLAFGFISVSCSKSTSESTSSSGGEKAIEVVDIEADAAAKLLAEGAVSVLDVRTPEEFSLGHIANAIHHNIYDDNFVESVKALDQSKSYLVHCATGVDGGRSRKAVESLKAAGATKIYHLNGGIVAWQQAGEPTEK